MPLSFNSREFLTYPLSGFSLRWYEQFFTSAEWMRAFENSFIVGSASTLLATALGTLAALGLTQANFRGKGLVMAILLSPMIVPVIIVAVGFYFFFAPFGLTGTYLGLMLAHTALGAPFVVVTVVATLQGFDREPDARRREPGRQSGDDLLPRRAAADRPRRRLGGAVRLCDLVR